MQAGGRTPPGESSAFGSRPDKPAARLARRRRIVSRPAAGGGLRHPARHGLATAAPRPRRPHPPAHGGGQRGPAADPGYRCRLGGSRPLLRPGLAEDARGAGRPCAGAGGGETRRRCGDAHPLACRTPGWGGGGVRGAGAESGARTARRARRARRTWPGDGLFRRHAPRGDRLRAGRVGAHRGTRPALRQGLAEPATVLTAVGPPLGGDMEIARWQALRELFDAVCDAPPEHWEPRLRTLSEDPALIAEALDLLHAQTSSFDRALQPLHALMASLPDAELQVGGRLGAWQLVERLGSGGMGTVFVAERADGLFRQRVAIKLLRGTAAGGATAERLAAERQILADLQHPDIA